jgi:mycothiol synthase
MTKYRYSIRNYTVEDFENYIRFYQKISRTDLQHTPSFSLTIAERLNRPGYDPTRNLFLAFRGGDIIAYLDITTETIIKRAVVDCMVLPTQRRRGIATDLFNQALRYIREIGIECMHVNISEDNVAAKELLKRLEFHFIRRYIQFGLNLDKLELPEINMTGIRVRYLETDELSLLTDLQNHIFTGTWGFNPNTIEEINYFFNCHRCHHSDIILVVSATEVIGYCWTIPVGIHTQLTYEKTSRIHMFGIAPEFRGQKLGNLLLTESLRALQKKGIGYVILTADCNNEIACALYYDCGFRPISNSVWYEKK